MKKTSFRNSLLLLLAAAIWGSAFVAQSVGLDYVGVFTFNGVRNLIGGTVLLPIIVVLDHFRAKGASEEAQTSIYNWKQKELFIGGICCGVVLFAASSLQQYGIKYTTVGKAGFITAMYIVIVPLMGIFVKRAAGIKLWISVFLAVAGLYLLCMTESFSLGKGDIALLLCAATFSVHILVIDHFSPKVDGVRMSCIQFYVCGVLSMIVMAFTEQFRMEMVLQAWMPLLYAAVLSSGVAYTLQIVGQRGLNPTLASLIMSLESVFSVLAGWLVLGQILSQKESIGCILMFVAIIIAQLPERKR